MSLPETGRFEANVNGNIVVFDGENWTGPDNWWFNDYASIVLKSATDRHIGTHITCPEAGRKILEDVFKNTPWTVLAEEVDQWETELPPGWSD